ncbi:hypothetical protein BROUX41_003457 [Berkeleyomyces rouxiae]|uniref:uncharacterized protein n=1 Tax=Berkeleyomyces rouxiae TaxID=2035830 RepID=UPI003B817CA1
MAGRDRRRNREQGNDSERKALRSSRDTSRYRSRTRETDRETTDRDASDSERDRERQKRREERQHAHEQRERTRDPERRRRRPSEPGDSERRRTRPEESRDRATEPRERTREPRDRRRETREHTAESRDRTRHSRDHTREARDRPPQSRDRTRTRERSERELERTRERAARDRERLRSTSRPTAALELDTESEDEAAAATAAAETRGLQRKRREPRHPPRPKRRPSSAAPHRAAAPEDSDDSEALPSRALALTRTGEQSDAQHPRSRSRSRRRQAAQPLLGAVALSGAAHMAGTGVKRRVVSGAYMEEGNASELMRGGASPAYSKIYEKPYPADKKSSGRKCVDRAWFTKKRLIIIGIVGVVLLIIIIVVAVVVSNNNNNSSSSSSNRSSSGNSNSSGRNQVPTAEKNTDMDPWSWLDTTDFNMTYTNATVGDLPIIGLYSDWDDSAQANSNVPALDQEWGSYTKRPARGVNLGGWLSLEPFITPSLFSYSSANGIIDEYTLTSRLGGSSKSTLEKHYSTFITESDFKAIADAGLDHVRIPFSYWAVEVYDDEPYLHRTSWRYLLRGIEWARKYGLRVNLDIHALPGSQNGWNHSGRQGAINWLNGTNGATNAQRSLDIHDKLSKFFAQDRYKNLIAFYGLANEPRMTSLSVSAVVNWTESAFKIVRDNGIQAPMVFGDGFMGLENWKGLMTGYGDSLVLDVHQYVIFDANLIVFSHADKIKYACNTWTSQAEKSSDTSTGFGPTMFAEWSQADTDCTRHLTNVGWGNRWEGTYDTGVDSTSTLTPSCPAKDSSCRCAGANADPSEWSSAYKDFLRDFAQAQMHSFERGWGWWYWTWKTESAPQWSYQAGLDAGVMPAKAYDRSFDCSNLPTSYPGLEETY